MYPEAERLLTREPFDLIILSAILSQEEKDHIWTIVGDTPPILTLKKLVFASELLRDVERRLGQVRQPAWSRQLTHALQPAVEALEATRALNHSIGVPHVRTSVRGPKMKFFERFYCPGRYVAEKKETA
jgi:hypothetical protein